MSDSSFVSDTEGVELAETDLSQEEISAQFDQITSGASVPEQHEHEDAPHVHAPEPDHTSVKEIEAALAQVSSEQVDKPPITTWQESAETTGQQAQVLTEEPGQRNWLIGKMKEKIAIYAHKSDMRIKDPVWAGSAATNLLLAVFLPPVIPLKTLARVGARVTLKGFETANKKIHKMRLSDDQYVAWLEKQKAKSPRGGIFSRILKGTSLPGALATLTAGLAKRRIDRTRESN